MLDCHFSVKPFYKEPGDKQGILEHSSVSSVAFKTEQTKHNATHKEFSLQKNMGPQEPPQMTNPGSRGAQLCLTVKWLGCQFPICG